MRAVAVTEPGGLEVLRVVDRPVREAGPGDVRVAVKAAAVNPTDIGLRQRGVEGLEAPWVPGVDAAGTVESLGEDVERLGVGDAVMAAVSPRRPEGGAQAELIVVPVASVVPVPSCQRNVAASCSKSVAERLSIVICRDPLFLRHLTAGSTSFIQKQRSTLAHAQRPRAGSRD